MLLLLVVYVNAWKKCTAIHRLSTYLRRVSRPAGDQGSAARVDTAASPHHVNSVLEIIAEFTAPFR
jgi:hypothetical protein